MNRVLICMVLFAVALLAPLASAQLPDPQFCNSTVDCLVLSGPCTVDVDCENNVCVALLAEDGSECEPHDWCFSEGVCSWGECAPTVPRDCSAFDDMCNTGSCDSNMQQCYAAPVPQGEICYGGSGPCIDGNSCDGAGACVTDYIAQGEICDAGVAECEYPGVCSGFSSECEYPGALPDSTPCDTGLFCNVDETCQTGQCVGGVPRDCSGFADQCNDVICDENMDACVAVPLSSNTTCVSGLYFGECLDAERCDGAGACEQLFKPNGTLCRQGDGTFCNEDEFCTGLSSFCPLDSVNQTAVCLDRPLGYHDHDDDDDDTDGHYHYDDDDHDHTSYRSLWWIWMILGLVAVALFALFFVFSFDRNGRIRRRRRRSKNDDYETLESQISSQVTRRRTSSSSFTEKPAFNATL